MQRYKLGDGITRPREYTTLRLHYDTPVETSDYCRLTHHWDSRGAGLGPLLCCAELAHLEFLGKGLEGWHGHLYQSAQSLEGRGRVPEGLLVELARCGCVVAAVDESV